MIIKFIGTGSGKTGLKRFHSSFLLSENNYLLLIDAGDSISRALLTQEIKYNSINGILLTHLHADHWGGLASLVTQMKLTNRKESLDFYINKSHKEYVEMFITASGLYIDHLGFKLNFVLFENNEEVIVHKKLKFLPRKNTHVLNKHKVNLPDEKFQSFSICFTIAGEEILYTSDVSSGYDLNLFNDKSCSTFICETTHIKFDDILTFVDEKNPDRIILTHIDEDDEPRLIKKIKQQNNEAIIIAYDGLTIEL